MFDALSSSCGVNSAIGVCVPRQQLFDGLLSVCAWFPAARHALSSLMSPPADPPAETGAPRAALFQSLSSTLSHIAGVSDPSGLVSWAQLLASVRYTNCMPTARYLQALLLSVGSSFRTPADVSEQVEKMVQRRCGVSISSATSAMVRAGGGSSWDELSWATGVCLLDFQRFLQVVSNGFDPTAGLRGAASEVAAQLSCLSPPGEGGIPPSAPHARVTSVLGKLGLLHLARKTSLSLQQSQVNLARASSVLTGGEGEEEEENGERAPIPGSPANKTSLSSSQCIDLLTTHVLCPVRELLVQSCEGVHPNAAFQAVCSLIRSLCTGSGDSSASVSGGRGVTWNGAPFPACVPDETVTVLVASLAEAVHSEGKVDEHVDADPNAAGLQESLMWASSLSGSEKAALLIPLLSTGVLDVMVTVSLQSLIHSKRLSSQVCCVTQLLAVLFGSVSSGDAGSRLVLPYVLRPFHTLCTGVTAGVANHTGLLKHWEPAIEPRVLPRSVFRPALARITSALMTFVFGNQRTPPAQTLRALVATVLTEDLGSFGGHPAAHGTVGSAFKWFAGFGKAYLQQPDAPTAARLAGEPHAALFVVHPSASVFLLQSKARWWMR